MTNNLPVIPASGGLLGARTKEDFIAMLYPLLPILQVILLTYGTPQDQAVYWIAVAGAVLQLVLQFKRTADFGRKAFYTVLLLINAGLVIYVAGWSPDALDTWMPLITAVIGGTPALFALQNVNTSGTRPVTVDGEVEGPVTDREL